MKKISSLCFYSVCFFVLAVTIYQIAVHVPPPPGSRAYGVYQLLSTLFSVLLAGTVVGAFLYIETKK